MRSYEVARREAAGEPVPFQVGYYDAAGVRQTEIFNCHGEVSSFMLSEFARNADMEVTDPSAMALLAQFFLEAFGDEAEYRRFFRFRNQHKIPDEQVMEIIGGLVEDLAARPTVQPSSSQGGPSKSGPTLRVDSSPAAIGSPQRFTVIEGLDELEASSA